MLLSTVMQPLFSEPAGQPSAALAPSETRRNVEKADVLVQPRPPAEPADRQEPTDLPKTEIGGANPGIQPPPLVLRATEAATSPEPAASPEPAKSPDPATPAVTDIRPAAGLLQAPSQDVSDTSEQQNKAAAGQSSAQTSDTPPQPAPAAPAPENMRVGKPFPEGKTVPVAIEAQITIHYWQGSKPARVSAQRLAAWLASSGYGAPQIVSSAHTVQSPVVRYFFRQDADAASLLVRALQKRDGSWRAEDCVNYRHKPPTRALQMWPVQLP